MAYDAARAKSLFLAALDLADPVARVAYLERECSGDAELRDRVEALLRADENAPSPQTGPFEPNTIPPRPASTGVGEERGAIIDGKYKLLQMIGEGGMGEVWMAEQSEPVHRTVALKVIKAGMDSGQVVARFEAERQALALMDHPNIARVFDGGVTENRRPFFVMELVKGTPITKYCDEHRLTIPERLELFVTVCQAIQHAHQKGIIHRDIKPSNVLVAPYDGRPVVKVIDFGIAKATGQKLTEKTMFTEFGAVVGTFQYMSPEQAEMNNQDIDTRSDIYSLGVLLYEMLTGTTPLDMNRMRGVAMVAMLMAIHEEEPPKPSTRLSESAESLPSVAAQRKLEPARLSKMIRGDLDWITMKALEKDRSRRYETANGLAMEIQRYLADEPVLAGPPSATYRLRKFVKRNKPAVVAASVTLFALIAAISGTTWGLIQAVKAREAETKRADDERLNALAIAKERDEKELARRIEERERKFAQGIASFVKDDFLALTSVEGQERFGGKGLDHSATLLTLLERAAGKLKKRKDLDPRTEGELCWIIGVNYRGAGEPAKGVPFLERAVELMRKVHGPDHIMTLNALNSLGVAHGEAGNGDQAEVVFEESLRLQKAKLGSDHRETLLSMAHLGVTYSLTGKLDQAVGLLEETLRLQKATGLADRQVTSGPLPRSSELVDSIYTMHNLGVVYQANGQLTKAVRLLEESQEQAQAKLGPDHPDTLTSMNLLAGAYQQSGQASKALPLFEEAFQKRKAKLGDRHPDSLTSMNSLANGYVANGQSKKGLALLTETLTLRKSVLEPDHPDTLVTMHDLANAYGPTQITKVLQLLEEVLEKRKAKLGLDHPHTLDSMNRLAEIYSYGGQVAKALPLFEESLQKRKAKLGSDHPDTLTSLGNLAGTYAALGQLAKTLPLLEETFRKRKVRLSPEHPDILLSMNDLAACYWSLGRLQQSVPMFEELLPLQEKTLGRKHYETQQTVANLGVNYKDVGRLAEAIPLLEEASHATKDNPQLFLNVGYALPEAYRKSGKPGEAAKAIKRLVADTKNLPRDNPLLSQALANLALASMELEDYATAEPILRECLTIRETNGPDDWRTFNTKSTLGGALLGQKKYAEAEPLLLAGYEGMKRREKSIELTAMVRVPQAIERLVQLYEAIDKKDEAAKWRAELETFKAKQKPEGKP